jgi:hypothetical protein
MNLIRGLKVPEEGVHEIEVGRLHAYFHDRSVYSLFAFGESDKASVCSADSVLDLLGKLFGRFESLAHSE